MDGPKGAMGEPGRAKPGDKVGQLQVLAQCIQDGNNCCVRMFLL